MSRDSRKPEESNHSETHVTEPPPAEDKGKTQPDPRLRDKIPLKKEPRSTNN